LVVGRREEMRRGVKGGRWWGRKGKGDREIGWRNGMGKWVKGGRLWGRKG
jgi:hypothetical protein